MIPTSYPVSGDDFINRREIMEKLFLAFNSRQNVALVGLRRTGKTSIAKELLRDLCEREKKKTVKLIFDVQENAGAPGRFAYRLLISFLRAFKEEMFPRHVLETQPGDLLEIASHIDSTSLDQLSRFLTAYFPPSNADNERTVFERIWRFLDEFAVEQDIQVALVLDEFQSIKALQAYRQCKDILGLLQGIISSSQRHIWYLFTGSMVSMMDEIIEGSKSPFYGRVQRLDVGSFTKEDTIILAEKTSQKQFSGEAIELLWLLSGGIPYYILAIVNEAVHISQRARFISRSDIENSFVKSLTRGELGSHCNYLLNISLERSKKSALLKEVIKLLAFEPLPPGELAKKLRKEIGYTSLPLRNLQNMDLVRKEGKTYKIVDSILAMWLKYVYSFEEPFLDKIQKDVDRNYNEYIAKLKKERGFLFESYVRELLGKFDGTRLEKKVLPRFASVDSINIFDDAGMVFDKPSNVEIDALCIGYENWLCEFRFRGKTVGSKDIKILSRKKELVEKKLNLKIQKQVFVSMSGFSHSVLKQRTVWCVGQAALNTLLKNFSMRRLDRQEEE